MNVLSFEYDMSYHPPAPFANVEISGYDESLGIRTVWAMVDSGADVTVSPISILKEVGADY